MKQLIDKEVQEGAEKQGDNVREMEETVATLRETVWKLEAMNFSEQAKNKAIFDRLN
jgi:hypothetical protein